MFKSTKCIAFHLFYLIYCSFCKLMNYLLQFNYYLINFSFQGTNIDSLYLLNWNFSSFSYIGFTQQVIEFNTTENRQKMEMTIMICYVRNLISLNIFYKNFNNDTTFGHGNLLGFDMLIPSI